MGRPTLERVDVHGLVHTRDPLVRREVTLAEAVRLASSASS